MEINSPLDLASVTDDDIKLAMILDADPELLSPIEFELAIKIIQDAKDRWHEEEVEAAAKGKNPRTSKGMKKVKLSPERKAEVEDIAKNLNLDDLFK